MRKLKIDPEFKALLGDMDQESYKRLEKNCREDGEVIDPIVIWSGTDIIVDGHNRYEIAIDNKLDYQIKEMVFHDRAAVMAWMLSHQLGRRSLTTLERAKYIKSLESIIMANRKETKRGKAAPTYGPKTVVPEIVEASGGALSARTVRRDLRNANLIEKMPKSVQSKFQSGLIAISGESVTRFGQLSEDLQEQVVDVLKTIRKGSELESLSDVIKVVEDNAKAFDDPEPVKESAKLPAAVEKGVKMFPETLGKLVRMVDERSVYYKDSANGHADSIRKLLNEAGRVWNQWIKSKK